jgi:ATP-dependent DNA helicase RecQ
MPGPSEILKQYWGYDHFRPLQEDIVRSVIAGQDTLALLPTGGGKSICFQVPALMKPGLCLVVTPLIALMRDQVANLQKRNIPAAAVYAGMFYQDVEKLLEAARRGQYKFLYVSPERLQSKRFLEYCDGLPVNLIAVDEAHCISQWGYDFRPAYLQIAAIRDLFPKVPVLALTASATPKVQEDICQHLHFKNSRVFTRSFARPNLSYSVREVDDSKETQLQYILQRVPGSAIIYCRNRKRTRELAEMLERSGISASYYHAGLSGDERSARQELWLQSRIRVMVCTNAFGMGIDKPDVRVVLHADVPDSLEAYYQEAGRGGRDEKKSYAVLLYTADDLQQLIKNIALQFPELSDIRAVYQSLVNYLQVPLGSAEGVYYDFDIEEFTLRFELNIVIVYSALRILEQEGILQLSESVFMPSRIEFTVSKQTLYDFTDVQPAYEPLLDTLLRTYEGIFDHPVPIYERQVARIMRVPEAQVIKGLQELFARRILSYSQRKDEPQLCFLQERVSAGSLQINMARVKERMTAYKERVDAIIAYANNRNVCRTRQLTGYFGEKNTPDCGVCDICLQKKAKTAKPVSADTYEEVSSLLLERLSNTPAEYAEVSKDLTVKEETLLEVLQWMISEGLVIRDENGFIYKK